MVLVIQMDRRVGMPSEVDLSQGAGLQWSEGGGGDRCMVFLERMMQ